MLAAAAWLLTYLVHSSLLLTIAALAARWRPHVAESAWRIALLGGLATSTIQLGWLQTQLPPLSPYGVEPARLPTGISPWLPIFLSAWLLVASFRMLSLVRARSSLKRLLADRVPLRDRRIAERARFYSGGGDLRITTSRRVPSPLVVGQREVCLPDRAISELPPSELDAVLAHEIAHVRRRDQLWLSLASVIERVFFLQPLNVLAARRLRALAECSCDDWALRRIESPLALASALTRVGGWLAPANVSSISVGMASSESLALARVRRILDPAAVRLGGPRAPLPNVIGMVALLAIGLVVPGFSPHVQYTIQARDDAGPFTITIERGAVVAMTIDGAPVAASRLQRDGDRLRVLDRRAGMSLDLQLTRQGGISWTSGPPQAVLAR
jgi:Zn-dependent protease with chaperone function